MQQLREQFGDVCSALTVTRSTSLSSGYSNFSCRPTIFSMRLRWHSDSLSRGLSWMMVVGDRDRRSYLASHMSCMSMSDDMLLPSGLGSIFLELTLGGPFDLGPELDDGVRALALRRASRALHCSSDNKPGTRNTQLVARCSKLCTMVLLLLFYFLYRCEM